MTATITSSALPFEKSRQAVLELLRRYGEASQGTIIVNIITIIINTYNNNIIICPHLSSNRDKPSLSFCGEAAKRPPKSAESEELGIVDEAEERLEKPPPLPQPPPPPPPPPLPPSGLVSPVAR